MYIYMYSSTVYPRRRSRRYYNHGQSFIGSSSMDRIASTKSFHSAYHQPTSPVCSSWNRNVDEDTVAMTYLKQNNLLSNAHFFESNLRDFLAEKCLEMVKQMINYL